MKTSKYILSGFLVVSALVWAGAPWEFHDGPLCSGISGDIKGPVNCGYKAFYHITPREYFLGAQDKLVSLIAGDRPMMLNIRIREPYRCDTGLTVEGLDDAYFYHDTFEGQNNPKSCPIFSGRK